MLKKLVLTHFLPFALACLFFWIWLVSLNFFHTNKPSETILVEGKQLKISGYYANLGGGDQTELDFMASLMNKEQLTIFGSSEFTDSPYCSYNFLPDSLGLQTLGVGHAFHQSFSILCELLAANKFVEGANICVVISSSWFHTYGTNTEAFIEFVIPRFLDKIATDNTLESKYKIAVGKYIHEHKNEFTNLSNSMLLLVDEYYLSEPTNLNFFKAKLRKMLLKNHGNIFPVQSTEYLTSLKYIESKTWNTDRKKFLNELQENFISSNTTNSIYVNDQYFLDWVIDENGAETKGEIAEINLEQNQELEDFKLLVDFLTSRSAKCSFIIQPMNPYYYQFTERNIPLVDTLTRIFDENKIPYLNLYANTKADYDPATLKDIMHLGDYGWMKINYFLDSLYNEH